jgi:hypothetical protein
VCIYGRYLLPTCSFCLKQHCNRHKEGCFLIIMNKTPLYRDENTLTSHPVELHIHIVCLKDIFSQLPRITDLRTPILSFLFYSFGEFLSSIFFHQNFLSSVFFEQNLEALPVRFDSMRREGGARGGQAFNFFVCCSFLFLSVFLYVGFYD